MASNVAYRHPPRFSAAAHTKGLDVNAKANDGRTPLHVAAMRNQKDKVELFLTAGADVDAKDANGKTPLDLATKKNKAEARDVLLKHGGKSGQEASKSSK